MTEQLRCGMVARTPAVELTGEVEIDEVYVVAGHKGQPEEVAKSSGLPSFSERLEQQSSSVSGGGSSSQI